MHTTSRVLAAIVVAIVGPPLPVGAAPAAIAAAPHVKPQSQAPAATRPADTPAGAAGGVVVDDLTLDGVLQANQHYKSLQAAIDKIDAEIADSRFGAAHPRMMKLRAQRAAWRQKLVDVREEVRAAVEKRGAVDAERVNRAREAGFIGEGLGMLVDRVPAAAAAALNLPRGAGLLVHRVLPNTAASAATILPGDVLLRVDGQLLVNNEQFEVMVESLGRDREVEVKLFRDGSALTRTIRVTTGAK